VQEIDAPGVQAFDELPQPTIAPSTPTTQTTTVVSHSLTEKIFLRMARTSAPSTGA
jgi:hypothetical protein